MGMDQELYKFRAIIGHQGPLLVTEKYPRYFPWYLVVVVLIYLAVLKSD